MSSHVIARCVEMAGSRFRKAGVLCCNALLGAGAAVGPRTFAVSAITSTLGFARGKMKPGCASLRDARAGVQGAVAAAGRGWGDAGSVVQGALQQLRGLMADHGSGGGGGPLGELHRHLTTGALPPSLQAFLTQRPGSPSPLPLPFPPLRLLPP